MNETIGSRIAKYRKEKSMTQEDLAREMGVSAQAVSKWENDLSCPDITPNMTGCEGMESIRNLDLAKIMDLAERGIIGKIVEAESAEGDLVEVVVE